MVGDYVQGRKTSGKNVEVDVEIRDAQGKAIPFAIFAGSGESRVTNYESVIYYHTNNPKYMETIRIDVPYEQVEPGTHIYLTFRHCSSADKCEKNDRAFGFAVLPIMRTKVETIIADGEHRMRLFKFDKKSSVPEVYMSAVFDDGVDSLVDMDATTVDEDASMVGTSNGSVKLATLRDSFTCKTMLCSTRLTQDVSLLNLLNWRKIPQADMRTILKNFTFIGPLEITKYL